MTIQNTSLPQLPAGITVSTEAGCIDIFNNVFSEEISNKIIEIFEEADNISDCPIKYSDALVGNNEPGGEIRSNLILPVQNHYSNSGEQCSCRINDALSFIQEIFSSCVRHYCEKYNLEIAFDEGFQLLKYYPGKEYKPHCDYGPGSDWRVLSGLIYLNPSKYEGGATYFVNYQTNINPQSPSIVLFPSNYAYTHRARAVLSGVKYAIVTWMGPPWTSMP